MRLLELCLTIVLEAERRLNLLLFGIQLWHCIGALPPIGKDMRALAIIGARIAQNMTNAIFVAIQTHQATFVCGIAAVLQLRQFAVDLLAQLLLLFRGTCCSREPCALAQLVRRETRHFIYLLRQYEVFSTTD